MFGQSLDTCMADVVSCAGEKLTAFVQKDDSLS